MALAALKVELQTWGTALQCAQDGDTQNALELFEKIGDNSRISMNIAILYRDLGGVQLALEQLTKAISMDQTLVVAYFIRAECYYSLGRLEEASDDLSDATQFMRSDRYVDYSEQGLNYTLCAAEVLYNKGVVLLELGRQSDGLVFLKKAISKKMRPGHHRMHETLSHPEGTMDMYRFPKGKLFRPTVSKMNFLEKCDCLANQTIVLPQREFDTRSMVSLDKIPEISPLFSSSLSFSTTISPASDASSGTYVPSTRSFGTPKRPFHLRRHTMDVPDPKAIPTRMELERQMGRDIVMPTTEISTVPCAGIRVMHGSLAGLMAFRFVVSLDTEHVSKKKSSHSVFLPACKSVVANFILDTGIGSSPIPPEILRALGYSGSLTPGKEIRVIVQGVKMKCIIGLEGEAARLGGSFLTSGSLTFTFDSSMDAPVLYVADQFSSHHFIPRTVAPSMTAIKRLSLKEVIASFLTFRKQLPA